MRPVGAACWSRPTPWAGMWSCTCRPGACRTCCPPCWRPAAAWWLTTSGVLTRPWACATRALAICCSRPAAAVCGSSCPRPTASGRPPTAPPRAGRPPPGRAGPHRLRAVPIPKRHAKPRRHTMNSLSRRTASLWAAAGLLSAVAGMAAPAAAAAAAAVANYPERPVTLVVTYPPGGTVDVVARLIGPRLSAELGQPVVIENRGGAGGMIGGAQVAKAQPDGYTLMLDASNHAQNPAIHARMQFDTLKAFAPVSLLLRVPNVLVVAPSSPIKTVHYLIQPRHPHGALHLSF